MVYILYLISEKESATKVLRVIRFKLLLVFITLNPERYVLGQRYFEGN